MVSRRLGQQGITFAMAGGISSIATYAQRTVTFLLFGATCYYGTALVHSSYLLRKRRKETESQRENAGMNVRISTIFIVSFFPGKV